MQKIEFNVKENKELIKAIIDELPFLSRFDVKRILENKDVKVNNQRTKESFELHSGDNVKWKNFFKRNVKGNQRMNQ